eukprot:TRINITY_DN39943_c0_g1_i2.p1 TRINITY_DN39943_c0_g1~~TRINITY_DN39943_c0_g1_i2.p1  ORF type:complete len:190 (-),score=47.07 TRINITY_DN39943_c0_g1_i2:92-661(-)
MRLNEHVRLAGERCILVPYEACMVPRYHDWMLSPQLQELTGSEPLSLEEEYEMQQTWRQDEDKLTFVVLDKDLSSDPALGEVAVGGGMAGDVNVFFGGPPIDDEEETGAPTPPAAHREGEIEVMVAEPDSRRKGLASEALRLIMAYCQEKLGTQVFVAKIKSHNAASIALFERLGFVFVKEIAIFGEVI